MGKTLEKIIGFCKRRKKTLLAGVLSLSLLGGIAGYHHKEIYHWFSKRCWNKYAQEEDTIDILANDVYLKVDEENKTLSARSELELDTRGSDISLILSPKFTIDRAEIDGIEAKASRDFLGWGYVVTIKNENNSQQCRLTLEYHRTVEDKSITREGITSKISEIKPASHSIPIDSDSFLKYRISIEVPDDKVGIAPGKIIEVIEKEDKKVFVYETGRMRRPAIVIGKFKHETREIGDKTFHLYYNNLEEKKRNNIFRNSARAVWLYSELFGDLENSTYTTVALPNGGGCYSCFSMSVNREKRCGFSITFHELAHSWWGGRVINNKFNDAFNESLATYSALIGLERFGRKKQFEGELERKGYIFESDYFPSINDSNGFSEYNYAVYYDKAPFVLHQLRQTMGDEDFFRGIRDYFQQNQYKKSSIQRFEQVMNQNSSIDLTDFFEEHFGK